MTNKQVTEDIHKHIDEEIERLKTVIYRNLAYVGESCATIMKQKGDYQNQTGNLRSSIGYAIADRGKVIKLGGFGGNGDEGESEGITLAEKIAGEYLQEIVLILVAGMNYASYVSAMGYDVIDSGELLAESLVPIMLNQLNINHG